VKEEDGVPKQRTLSWTSEYKVDPILQRAMIDEFMELQLPEAGGGRYTRSLVSLSCISTPSPHPHPGLTCVPFSAQLQADLSLKALAVIPLNTSKLLKLS